jgi:hypothetical protein
MIRLLAHPLPPSPLIKLSLFLSLPVCHLPVELTDGGEGVGESQIIDREEAWPSINRAILSGCYLLFLVGL